VLSLLGVGQADITADFALTGLATQRLIADWRAFYPDRALLWPHYGKAPAAAMRVFLTELEQRHGSVRGYVTDYLGVPDAVISELRARYVDREATAAG
jgi:protein-tyrosine phosphatase